MSSEGVSSVDAVHDGIDKLILSIFDAMRNEEVTSDSSNQAAETILSQYRLVKSSINNLPGINSTNEQLDLDIQAVQIECEESRRRILALDDKVKDLGQAVDKRLLEVSCRELFPSCRKALKSKLFPLTF